MSGLDFVRGESAKKKIISACLSNGNKFSNAKIKSYWCQLAWAIDM